MSSHTPGPWVHYPEDNIIATQDGHGLLEWQARSVHVPIAERDANARLIAAAPDMLEALRQIAAIEDLLVGADWEEIEQARCIARAAIAKATGEKQ